MQTLCFQRSINFPAPLNSYRPSRSRRSSTTVRASPTLDELRLTAARLEDRIVFSLVERSMYGYNPSLYNLHASLDLENEGGMLRRVVSKLEHLQAAFGGFRVPEKVPFFPQSLPEEWRSATDPDAAMPEPENPLVLDPVATALNFNSKLWSLYVLGILAHMNLKLHNDGRQGSALICDASCIQAISKRVHWGKFLAEAKFQSSPEKFKQAVEAQNLKKPNNCLMCQEHKDGAVERYVQMANARWRMRWEEN